MANRRRRRSARPQAENPCPPASRSATSPAGVKGRRRRRRPSPLMQEVASQAAAAVVLVLGSGGAALALPEGMVVTGGQLQLSQPRAGEALIQQGSNRAAADFRSFNIGAGERVQVQQPSASSALLGRVTGGDITEIHGRLDANGRVILVNPAGVLVGPTGTINTAAFTATTLQVNPARFMAGGPVELKALPAGQSGAVVINQGSITVADGGFAALIAPQVVNQGVITAKLGQVQLASGTQATLDISGDGLLSVALDPAVAGSITSSGTLQASHVRLGGGDAAALAAATVNLSGVVEARSAADLLKGGRITVEGETITVGSGAVLDARGASGGGEILVGGSWRNSDPSVRQATSTTIEAGARLDASATRSGNGGTVVAWSDLANPRGVTTVAGRLRAQGGPNGGDGGGIETSGHLLKVDGIRVSTLAPEGRNGLWLLDPTNVTIAGTSSTGSLAGDLANAGATNIRTTDIQSAINAGNNVSIVASGAITQSADLAFTVAPTSQTPTLTLDTTLGSQGAITLAAITDSSTASGSGVHLVAKSQGGAITAGGAINVKGSITLDNTYLNGVSEGINRSNATLASTLAGVTIGANLTSGALAGASGITIKGVSNATVGTSYGIFSANPISLRTVAGGITLLGANNTSLNQAFAAPIFMPSVSLDSAAGISAKSSSPTGGPNNMLTIGGSITNATGDISFEADFSATPVAATGINLAGTITQNANGRNATFKTNHVISLGNLVIAANTSGAASSITLDTTTGTKNSSITTGSIAVAGGSSQDVNVIATSSGGSISTGSITTSGSITLDNTYGGTAGAGGTPTSGYLLNPANTTTANVTSTGAGVRANGALTGGGSITLKGVSGQADTTGGGIVLSGNVSSAQRTAGGAISIYGLDAFNLNNGYTFTSSLTMTSGTSSIAGGGITISTTQATRDSNWWQNNNGALKTSFIAYGSDVNIGTPSNPVTSTVNNDRNLSAGMLGSITATKVNGKGGNVNIYTSGQNTSISDEYGAPGNIIADGNVAIVGQQVTTGSYAPVTWTGNITVGGNLLIKGTLSTPGSATGIRMSGNINGGSGSSISFVSNNSINHTGTITLAGNTSGSESSVTYDTTTGTKDSTISSGALNLTGGVAASTTPINYIVKTSGAAISVAAINVPGYILLDNTWGCTGANCTPASGFINSANAATYTTASNGITLGGALTAGTYAGTTGVTIKGVSTTGFALNQGNNAITSNAGGITIQGSGTTATTVISGSGAFTNAAGNIAISSNNTAAGGNWSINLAGAINQNANGGNISFSSNQAIYQGGTVTVAANTSGTASSVTYNTTTGNLTSQVYTTALTLTGGISASNTDINYSILTSGAPITVAAISVPGYIRLDNTWGGTAGPGGTPTSGFITSSNYATTATTTANGVTFTGNLTAGKGITLRGASYSANHGVYSAGLNLTTAQGDIVITGISNTGSGYWNQYAGTLTATTGNISFTGYIGAGNAAVNLNTTLITAPQGTITANGTVNGNGLFAVWSSGSISAGAGISITGSTNSSTSYAPVSLYSNLAVTGTGSTFSVSGTRSTAGGALGIDATGSISGGNGSSISLVSNNKINQTGPVLVAANTTVAAANITYDTTTGTKDSTITSGPLALASGSTSDINFIEKTAGAAITAAAINVPGYILLDNTWGGTGGAGGTPTSGFINSSNYATTASTTANGVTFTGNLTAGKGITLRGASYSANHGVYSAGLNLTTAQGDIVITGISNTGSGYWNQYGGILTATTGNINFTGYIGAGNAAVNLNTTLITAPQGTITANGTVNGNGLFAVWSSGSISAGAGISITGSTNSNTTYAPVSLVASSLAVTGTGSTLSVSATRSTAGGALGIDTSGTISGGNGSNISFSSNNTINQTGAISLAANKSANPGTVSYNTTTGTKDTTITTGPLTVATGSTAAINYEVKASGAQIKSGNIDVPGYILLDNTYLNGVQGGINLANAPTYATTNGVYGALLLSRLSSGSLAGSTGITLNGVSNTSGHASVEPSGNPINSATTININAINASTTGWGYATLNGYSNGPLTAAGNITLVAAVGASAYNAALITSPITSTNGTVTITATSSGTGNTIAGSADITGNRISIAATASSTQATVMSLGALTINACSTGCSRRDLTVTATNGTAGGNTGISQTGAITQNANGGSISFASNNSINQIGALSMVANTSGNPASVTYDTTTGTRLSTITSGALTVGTGSTSDINFIEKTAGAGITAAAINVPGYILLDNTWGGTAGPGGTATSGFITSSNYATTATTTADGVKFTGNLTAGKGITIRGASFSANHGVYSEGFNMTTAQGDIVVNGISNTGYGYWHRYAGTLTATTGNIDFTGYMVGGTVAVGLNTNLITAPQGTITVNSTVNGNGLFAFWSSGSISAGAGITVNGTTNSNSTYYAVDFNATSLAVTGTGSSIRVNATRSTAGGSPGINTNGTISGGNGSNISFSSNNTINQTGAISLAANTSANPGTVSYNTTTGTKDTAITTGALTVAAGSTTAVNYEIKASGSKISTGTINVPGYILIDNTYLNGVQGGINLANAPTYALTNGSYGALGLGMLTSGSLAGSTGITLNGVSNTSGSGAVEPNPSFPINSATTININAINSASGGWGYVTSFWGALSPLTAAGDITIVAAVGGSTVNAASITSAITSTNGNVTITATSSGTGKTIDANAAITGNRISIAATASSTQATVMSLGALTINACSTGCSRRDITVTATNGTAGGNTGISQTGAITQNANGGSISFASNNSINQTGALSMVANTSGKPSSVTYDTTTGTRLSTITSGALTVGTGSNTAINFIEKTAGAAITVAGISVPGSITLDNTYGCSGSGCTPVSGFINSSNATTLGASTHAIMINTGALTSGAYAIAEGITIKGVTANGYGIYSTQAITANKNNVVMTGVGTSGGVNQYNNVIARDGSIAISGTSASASGTGIYGYILNGAFKASGAIDLAGYTNFADGGSAIELNGLSLISGGNTTLSGRGGVSRVVYLPYVVAGVGGNFTVQGATLTNGIAAADPGTLVSARDNAINISGGSYTRPFEGQNYKDYTVAGDIWMGGTSSVVSNTHIVVLQAGSMTSTGGNITIIGKGEEASNSLTSTQTFSINNNLIANTGDITLASHQMATGSGNAGAYLAGASTTSPLLLKAGRDLNINTYASGTATGSGYALFANNYVLFKAGRDITFSSIGSSNYSLNLQNAAAKAGRNLTFQGAALGSMASVSNIAVPAPGTAAGNSRGHAVFLNGNIGLMDGSEVITGYNAAGNISIAGTTTGANYGVFSNAQITSTAGAVNIAGVGTTNTAVYDSALITGANGITVTGTSTTAATVVSLVEMRNTTTDNITVTGNNATGGANTGIAQVGQITQNANGGNISFISNNRISQAGAISMVANTSGTPSSITYDTTRGTKESTITAGALTLGSGSTSGINFIEKTAGAAISVVATTVPGYILLDNTWGAASGAPASGYITAANAAILATASAGVSVNGALTAGAYAGSTGITLKGISAAGYGVYSASNLSSGTGAYLTGTTTGPGSNAVYLNNVALSAAGTFTTGQDAISIIGTNGTTAAVNLLGNTSITNNSTRGRINIIANNGHFLDPVTVTSSSTAGAISVAAVGSTAAIVSAPGTTFTQNSNDGVFLSTSYAGNLQPPRIINNGSGNVYLAAGATLPVGTGSGGQIVGVSGNTISQAGSGITYLYSGNPSSTSGLGLLATPLATQSQANVRFGQAAGSGNTAFTTLPVTDGALYNTANLSSASPGNPVVRYRVDPSFNLRLSASAFSKDYGTSDAAALSTYFNDALISSGYSSTRSTTSAVTTYNSTTGNFTFSYGPVAFTYSKAQLVAGLISDNTGNRAGYGTLAGQQANTTTGYPYNSLKADSFIGGTFNAVNGADSPFTLVEKITPKVLTISNGTQTQLYDNTVTYNAVVTAAGTTSTGLVNTTVDGVTLTDTLTAVSQVLRSGATVGAGTILDGTTIAQAGPFNATPAAAQITGAGGLASTGNYAITYVGAVNTITPITVSVTVTGATTSVPYNGAVQTNAQATAVGVRPGESISFTGLATGTDVGVYNDDLVAVAGSGTNLANYVFNFTNGTLTITPLAATVTGNVSTKPYNGQPQTSGYTFTGVLPGDTSAITVNGAAFATRVAEGLVADQFTGASGAKAGNYTFTYVPGSIQITPRQITPSGVTALAKTYDGTTRADLDTSAMSLPGIIAGDDLVVTPTGTFADKNAALSKAVAITYAGTGPDAANYVFADTASSARIYGKFLIPTGITADNKQYDGTTTATVTIGTIGLRPAVAAALSSSTDGRPIAGDDVSYNSNDIWTLYSATFDDKNAGTGKSVNVRMILQTAGPRLLGADAGNYGLIINNFNTTADITPRPLTVSGITAADKTYDGTTTATLSTAGVTASSLQSGGMVAGDDLSILAATGQFSSKNVLRDSTTPSTILPQSVAVSAIPGGADLPNYTITYSPVTARITPATLTLTAHHDAKIVTQSDGANFNGASVSGLMAGDDATSAGVGTISVSRTGAGTVESAGSYGGVLVPSASGQPNNYTITTVNGDFTIVPAGQLLVKANNETTVYGDDYNYSIASAAYLPTGGGAAIFSFDINNPSQVSTTNGVVSLNDGAGGTASFTFGTQGSNLLSGASQLKAGLHDIGASGTPTISNPNLSSSTIVFVGSHQVTPRPISVSGITAADKVYDASPAATVSTTNALFNGRLVGDALALSATGQFTNKNAGLRTVELSSSYSGADLANYLITDQASTTATITPKALSVSGLLRTDKVYDGTTSASVLGTAVLAGAIGAGTGSASDGLPYDGDLVSVDQSAAVASFNDKNVPLATGLTFSGLVLTGAESGNYTLLPHPTVAASITPLTLTPSAQPLPQTYSGTTAAQLSLGLFGTLPGDQVALNGTSTLASPRAGVQTATTTGLSLSGPDAANYALPAGVNSLTTPDVRVNPAALTISGDSRSVVYNGQLQTNTYQVVGLMPADSLNLTVSGMAQARNVSDGSVPDILQYTLVNPGDYSVTLTNGTLQITPLTISASATIHPRTYDGTTNASATLSLNGVLPADAATLGVSGTTSLSGANAGNQTATVSGLTLSGNELGNYALAADTFNAGSVAVAKAALTVSGDVSIRPYNGMLQTNTFTVTGLVNGDTLTVKRSAQARNVSDGTVADNLLVQLPTPENYTVTINNGSLRITPLTISASATLNPKTYDGTTNAFSTLSLNGVLPGDLGRLGVIGTTTLSGANAGLQTATVSGLTLTGNQLGNYALSAASLDAGSLEVAKAPLLILPKADAKLLGQSDPAFAYSVQGLQGGDALGSVSITRTRGETPGTYDLSASAATAAPGTDLSNYAITYSPAGSFTILGAEKLLIRQPNGQAIYGTAAAAAISSVQYLAADGSTILSLSNTPGTNIWTDGQGGSITITPTVLGASIRSNAGLYSGVLTNTNSGTTNANGNFNQVVIVAGDLLITPAPLSIRGDISSRVYNGKVQVNSYSVEGLVNGDSLIVSGAAEARNVSEGTVLDQLQASLVTPGNYTVTIHNGSLQITPAPLVIVPKADAKLLGQRDPAFSFTAQGLQGRDALGSVAITRPRGETLGTYDLSATAATAAPGTDLSNYSISYSPGGSFTIVGPERLLIRQPNAQVVYGTAAAAAISSVEYLSGDGTTIFRLSNTPGTNIWSDGQGGSITITPTVLGASIRSNAGLYTGALTNTNSGIINANGNFNEVVIAAGDLLITPAALTIRGASSSRVYNGQVHTNTYRVEGLVNGDSVSVSGSAQARNVSEGTVLDRLQASLATPGNYTVTIHNGSLQITPYILDLSGTSTRGPRLTADADKTYDGTRSAGGLTLSGLFGGDAVSITGGTGLFLDANAGVGKTVTYGGFSLSGDDAANYALPPGSSSFTTTAEIARAAVTIRGVTRSQVYNGMTQSNGSAEIVGLLPGDALTISGYGEGRNVGTYADNLVASAAANTSLSNYDIRYINGAITITPYILDLSGSNSSGPRLVASASKTYDGTRQAGGGLTISGLLGGDAVSIIGGTGLFLDANAGEGKTVIYEGFSLSGADAANYALPPGSPSFTTTAEIARAALTIRGVTTSQVYNGTTQSNGSARIVGLQPGDALTISGYGAGRNVGTYADNLVATAAANTSLSNYDIRYINGATTITPYIFDLSGSSSSGPRLVASASKTYDGTRQAGGGLTLSGLFGGDAVSIIGGTGLFLDANAGEGKTVIYEGFSLSGADAANYALPPGSPSFTTTAEIARAALTITGSSTTKTFNGALHSNGSASIVGLVPGEQIKVSGYASGRDVGVYRDALTLTAQPGTSLANYTLLVRNGALTIRQPSQPLSPLQPPSQPLNVSKLLPIFAAVNPGVVQNQQSATSGLRGISASAGTPIGPSGLPQPYPISMASGADLGSQQVGGATALGPLKPLFLVQQERSERFVMGQGSVQIHPGEDVCLKPAGCAPRSSASTSSSDLEITGVESGARFPETSSLLAPEERWRGLPHRPSRTAPSPSARRRWTHWLFSAR